MTLAAIVLTFCLFAFEESASAQEITPSTRNNCYNVKGNLRDVINPTGSTGRITNGGILNGTTELLYTSGVLPTPDPNTFSYTVDFTITTHYGQLKTGNVGIFDGGNGVFSEIGRISPTASTGWFEGATGVLFTNGKTTDGGATFQSKITGEICFDH